MQNKNLIIEQALDGSHDLAAITLFIYNPGLSLGLKLRWLVYLTKVNKPLAAWMTPIGLAIHAKQYMSGMPLSH